MMNTHARGYTFVEILIAGGVVCVFAAMFLVVVPSPQSSFAGHGRAVLVEA